MIAQTSPVIVIGMHRSGTSLVSRILESLGVFMGYRQEHNAEAQFFLRLNYWVFKQSGGKWDRPLAVRDLIENTEINRLCVNYLEKMVDSKRAFDFLGPAAIGGKTSIGALEDRWGWKDPRSTFTLPLWLTLFPGSKVVHVHRNGVDVARSLVERGKQELDEADRRVASAKWTHALRFAPFPRKYKGRISFFDEVLIESVRGLSPDGAFGIWEEYVGEAERQIDVLPSSDTYTLRYETLLSEPEKVIHELVRALELDVSADKIATCSSGINKGRAHAYRNDSQWRGFYDKVKDSPLMRKYHYDHITDELDQ